ncbi:MAG TPA: hypothetical protein VFI47_30070, partial [Acidimicrobiales bacterium]|nr:hypothetical protein [Acidimicrobiales bacterium]
MRRAIYGAVLVLVLAGCDVPNPTPAQTLPRSEPTAHTVDATLDYGPDPLQKVDVYRPDPVAFPGPRPLVVYVHGGAWSSPDADRGDVSCADFAASPLCVPVMSSELRRGYVV